MNILRLKCLPKTELHIHIEGALKPKMILQKAQKNNINLPYKTIDDIKKSYHFNNVADFLKVNHLNMSVLVTSQDFYDLTWAYLKTAHCQNVKHVEVFFNPQLHLKRNVSLRDQIEGMDRAFKKAQEKWNLTSRLIMCFLRNESAENAIQILETARPLIDAKQVHGIGLSSSEIEGWVPKFIPLFEKVRTMNLFTVCHSGEEITNEHIGNVLDSLHPQRIDHGIQAVKDGQLLTRLSKEKIPLTLCPLSNQAVKACPDLTQFPIRVFLENKIIFSLNSDSPAYVGSLLKNYKVMNKIFKINHEEWKTIALNSVNSTFLSQEEKEKLINKINKHWTLKKYLFL